MLTFWLCKKALKSAEIHDTILVGDDTDLLVLSIYHFKSSRNSLFFAPEGLKLRRMQSSVFGTSLISRTWAFSAANIFYLSMPFWVVIQPLGCLILEKVQFWRSSKWTVLCNKQQIFLMKPHQLLQRLNQLGKKRLWWFIMERWMIHWILFNCEKVAKSFNKVDLRSLPPLGLPQNTAATMSFFKFANGMIMIVISY